MYTHKHTLNLNFIKALLFPGDQGCLTSMNIKTLTCLNFLIIPSEIGLGYKCADILSSLWVLCPFYKKYKFAFSKGQKGLPGREAEKGDRGDPGALVKLLLHCIIGYIDQYFPASLATFALNL